MVSITSQHAPSAGTMMPPPIPTSMTKRPTMPLKRDSSFLDTDDESNLSTTTKRLKVAFNPNVDVRVMTDSWTDKSFALVKEEVRIGIDRHLAPAEAQDDVQYDRLIQMLGQDPDASEAVGSTTLLRYIIALEARVSSLGDCGKLVMSVLDISWLGRNDDFLAYYVRFLVSLASSHSKFMPAIMERLVGFFTRLPASLGRLPNEVPVPRIQMNRRLHRVLEALVRQIPSASGVLARTIKFEFPNNLATTRSYNQYQKNLLELGKYATEIKAEIMSTIVQRLVAVDVQIQQNIEELEEEAEEKLLLQRPSSSDDHAEDSDDSDADSVSSSEETCTEEEERMRELRLKVAKMDSTMDLLFEYYAPGIQDKTDPETNEAYQQLLSHFVTFILPNRTRHAQFLLFHFSQTSSKHVLSFARRCIDIGFAAGLTTQRYTAIAYLSSFIARGSHIHKTDVQDVFAILCEYLEDLRKRAEPTCRGPDRRKHMLYYAVAQALLYIFCFRWRDLVIDSISLEDDGESAEFDEDDVLAESRELRWQPGLKEVLQKNIFGPLNPLKVCSPVIVSEFADIARHVRLIEVLSKVESNKRLRLANAYSSYGGSGDFDIGRRETAFDRKSGESHHQLEPYFPFDPYHLPQSMRWVQDDYNEWKLPRGMRRDEEDGYSDEESENDSDDEAHDDDFDDSIPLDMASNSS